MQVAKLTYEELAAENEHLRAELEEAKDTIEAIRTGQIDALIVQNGNGHELYTLKTADQTYRLFIEKMTEGAVTVSREGFILYSNSRFAALAGVPLSQVIGLHFKEFIAEAHRGQYEELFAAGWQRDTKGEVLLHNSKTPVQLSLTTLELEEGTFLSIIVTDLTAQKDNQQQLRNKNEELARSNIALELSNNDLLQFASVASHDLQEPLRKIQVFSNLLLAKNKGSLDSSSMLYLDKILESSGRMKQLIIDILGYSRLSGDGGRPETTDLNELMTGMLSDYEVMIAEKEAEIQIGKLPCITANKGQVRQVFQNIVSNALKFTRKGESPKIKITAEHIAYKDFNAPAQPDGKYCRILISDNGIGFDEKYLRNIFSLFERLNSKDQYDGSGIGLAIAKKIIEKHNGLITARSQEGKGATFIIVLPVSQEG